MSTKPHTEIDSEPKVAITLVVLTFIGVGLGYATSIFAARVLGPIGFEQYAVAVATLGVMSSIAEMGVGKNALKVLPSYEVSGEYSLASGYWRFGVVTLLLVSGVLSASVIGWSFFSQGVATSKPLAVAMLFLPFAAFSGVGIDFVMANRVAVGGAVIARVIVPGITLVLLAGAGVVGMDVSVSAMVVMYGSGAVVGAILAIAVFIKSSPSRYFSTKPSFHLRNWLRYCIYFAVSALFATALFRVSVLVMEALPVEAMEVAHLAAALDTGCLILLLAKSTDKLFQPQMSIVLAEADWETGMQIRTKRYYLIGSACAAFLLVIWLFGKRILSLYGEEFQDAYSALLFVSIGASAWTFFSLSPIFLHYRGMSVYVLIVTAAANVVLLATTAWLGVNYGAKGAGMAFGGVLATTIMLFYFRSRAELNRLAKLGNKEHYLGGL
ncbi:MAG: lipopolysaccharide biosynthesis protein [Rhodopirellula sp. JB053]